MVKEVVWAKTAQNEFTKAYKYIFEESIQNADKVREEIITLTNNLSENFKIHTPDKYKVNNDNSFRAFEVKHFRISYKITEKFIIIVRFRHTSKNPINY